MPKEFMYAEVRIQVHAHAEHARRGHARVIAATTAPADRAATLPLVS
jgi:hypothetical protein